MPKHYTLSIMILQAFFMPILNYFFKNLIATGKPQGTIPCGFYKYIAFYSHFSKSDNYRRKNTIYAKMLVILNVSVIMEMLYDFCLMECSDEYRTCIIRGNG